MYINIILIIILIIFIILKKKKEYFQNNNYINIFYINLIHRKDRDESIIKELNKIKKYNNNINIKRIDAIKDDKGAIGCAKSHVKSLKLAKKLGLKSVIISEDDIIIKNSLIKKYIEIINNLENIFLKQSAFKLPGCI